MAIFECTGGISPTGNARPSDVKLGVSFSNENDIDQVGTFAAQEKTIVSSRLDQIVIPDDGCYLSSVTVEGLEPTGTFKPTSRAANIDMGEESNYRYVNTESVPNNNAGTYTFGSGSTGGTVDLGITNSYRYVNAGNVYNTGYNRGRADQKFDSGLYVRARGSGGGNGVGEGYFEMSFPVGRMAILGVYSYTASSHYAYEQDAYIDVLNGAEWQRLWTNPKNSTAIAINGRWNISGYSAVRFVVNAYGQGQEAAFNGIGLSPA